VSSQGGNLSDMSMFDLFRIEVESQTAILSKNLLEIEDDPKSQTLLESLMRASHSLKGAARMVGVDPVVKVTHEMEDCFVAAQKGQVQLNSQHVDVFLNAVDLIVLISGLDENSLASWVAENGDSVDSLVKSLAGILAPESNESTIKADSQSQEDVKFAQEVVEAATQDTPVSTQNTDHGRVAESGGERTLRVDADRMSRILGVAGELLIESRDLRGFSESLYAIKRRHDELMGILECWRESLVDSSMESKEYGNMSLKHLDECRRSLSDQITLLDEFDHRNSNLTNKLYHEVAGSRMRPFIDGVVDFKRMVRDLARTLNKEIKFVIKGQNTSVDRDILEKIKAPLNHLLRNSIDHGIESAEAREASGKPRVATLTLTANHGGGMLKVSVKDDGAGIDIDKLKAKLVKQGLVDDGILGQLKEPELLEFLFLPDFSTRDEVTETSGRGVGLDVVRDMMRELRGTVMVDNKPGMGAKFVMQLPLSLSVISALLVVIADEPYAFPLSRVDRILKVTTEEIEVLEGRQYIKLNEQNIGLISAAQVLGCNYQNAAENELTVVIISDRLNQYGVVVDRFIGQRQLSVQAIDPRLGKIQDISAAALMENGDPLFIIDVDDMVRSIDHIVSGGGPGDVYQLAEDRIKSDRKRILVVDDSLTVREVERDLLRSNGYIVDLAVDGMDGWHAVRSKEYDLIITDVDMPRMDGIELVNNIRHDLHLKTLPVMIVSYKDRGEDRRRGLDAGADYYLTKGSFQDDTLVEAVIDLIGEATK